MNNELPELLPCPFCGGEAEHEGGGKCCAVACVKCGACSGWQGSEAEAIAAWNARAAVEQGEGGRDWTEDFSHENGQYACVCVDCKQTFAGHKRRVVCRRCSIAPPAAQPAPEWVTALRKEAMLGAMKDVYWLSRDQVLELIGTAKPYAPPAAQPAQVTEAMVMVPAELPLKVAARVENYYKHAGVATIWRACIAALSAADGRSPKHEVTSGEV